jgi:hypothetical protein
VCLNIGTQRIQMCIGDHSKSQRFSSKYHIYETECTRKKEPGLEFNVDISNLAFSWRLRAKTGARDLPSTKQESWPHHGLVRSIIRNRPFVNHGLECVVKQTMKGKKLLIQVFWNITTCWLVNSYRRVKPGDLILQQHRCQPWRRNRYVVPKRW